MNDNTDIAIIDEDEPQTMTRALPQPVAMTPAQARVDAVAALTSVALSKAATLQLTPDETDRLTAEFPDADFLPGAAGKENLIYIQHSALRGRLNAVLGLGQWALIVRESWNEDFMTKGNPSKGLPPQAGVRVYVRGMMLVRGCYVGESVGDMDYYPGNAAQNYGDAFEGAKTAAFRRCAKEFGVGVQAWDKHWCDSWWSRKRTGSRPVTPAPQTQREPAPAPSKPVATPTPRAMTPAERKDTLLTKLKGFEPEADAIFREESLVLPTEVFTDISEFTLERIAPENLMALIKQVRQRKADNDNLPYDEAPTGVEAQEDRSWEDAVLPFTSPKNPDAVKGMTLKELFANPKTSKYAFGLAMNFTAEPKTAASGKVYQPSQADIDFAAGCELWRSQHPQDKRD